MPDPRPTVAVVGSGVSGLTAAYVLSRTHRVTLWEADTRLGGHAHTHEVHAGSRTHHIDSGFIVHNNRTYPQLTRLFRELGVATRPTEMSMSTACRRCGLEYAGGRGPRGLFAQPRRAADPVHLRMLAEVPRFYHLARWLLGRATGPTGGVTGRDSGPTWGEFLREGAFSSAFVRHFALPLVACVWSSPARDARDYPARHLFTFLDHHGMLSVTGSPTWRTVVGGSGRYVRALTDRLDEVRTGQPVHAVERHEDHVELRTADGVAHPYDRAVLATHADDALGILSGASTQEKTALSALRYSTNEAVLHRDADLLPTRGGARASWNYRIGSCTDEDSPVLVSYWMNRLQGLRGEDQFLVTLNPGTAVSPDRVLARMTYRHPVFTREAVAAAPVLAAAGGPRVAFAGAHLGWGFHEDGARSGVAAATRLGVRW